MYIECTNAFIGTPRLRELPEKANTQGQGNLAVPQAFIRIACIEFQTWSAGVPFSKTADVKQGVYLEMVLPYTVVSSFCGDS